MRARCRIGHLHVIDIIVDPPFVRIVAIPGRHIDREWIAQAVSPVIWTRVCTTFARIRTDRNSRASVWFARRAGWIVGLDMFYGRFGIAWFLVSWSDRSTQFPELRTNAFVVRE